LNVIIDSLPQDALRQLGLKDIELSSGQVLYQPGDLVEAIYFPRTAIISLVVTLSTGETIEAAMVGRDGIIGAASALDGKISLSRAITQIPGQCSVCDSAAFKATALKSEKLLSLIMRHEQTVYAQAQQSVACMAAHNVESRLARWMLRARDLVQTDTLPFTQEFLSEMLGVRRTSVTLVAHGLQQAGLIKYRRGKIQITNVDGLHEVACECYGRVKEQYQNLLGTEYPASRGLKLISQRA